MNPEGGTAMLRYMTAAALGLTFCAIFASAQNKGGETELGGLKSRVPQSWQQKEVNTPNRVLQFALPKQKDDKYDGEMIVFFFDGGGGSVKANIDRWKNMITPPEGKKIDDVSKVDELKIGEAKATVLDAQGTYTYKMRPFDPNEKGEKRENYRLVGVVFETSRGPYFIRLVGPAKTIAANKQGFDDWLRNFK
jgi:hypothetical protein